MKKINLVILMVLILGCSHDIAFVDLEEDENIKDAELDTVIPDAQSIEDKDTDKNTGYSYLDRQSIGEDINTGDTADTYKNTDEDTDELIIDYWSLSCQTGQKAYPANERGDTYKCDEEGYHIMVCIDEKWVKSTDCPGQDTLQDTQTIDTEDTEQDTQDTGDNTQDTQDTQDTTDTVDTGDVFDTEDTSDTSQDTSQDTQDIQDTQDTHDTEEVEDTGQDTSQGCIDHGVSIGGYCWYLADPGDSCTQYCKKINTYVGANRGIQGLAADAATIHYIGYDHAVRDEYDADRHDGAYYQLQSPKCAEVINILVPGAVNNIQNVGPGRAGGCVYNALSNHYTLSANDSTTLDAVPLWNTAQRVCACEGIVPDAVSSCADGHGTMLDIPGSYNQLNGMCMHIAEEFMEKQKRYEYCYNLEIGGYDDWTVGTAGGTEGRWFWNLFWDHGDSCADSYPCGQLFEGIEDKVWVESTTIMDFSTAEETLNYPGLARPLCVRYPQ